MSNPEAWPTDFLRGLVTTGHIQMNAAQKTRRSASGFDRVTPDAAPKKRCCLQYNCEPKCRNTIAPGSESSQGKTDYFFARVGHYVSCSARSAKKNVKSRLEVSTYDVQSDLVVSAQMMQVLYRNLGLSIYPEA